MSRLQTAVLVSAVVLVAGCGGSSGSTDAPTTGVPSGGKPTPTVSAVAADSTEVATSIAATTTSILSLDTLSGRLAIRAVGCGDALNERNEDPSYVVCTMNIDGTDVREIATNVGALDRPDWSPDGTRLQWTEEVGPSVGVVVAAADGGDRRWVIETGSWVAATWSPDGTEVAMLGTVGLFVVGSTVTVTGSPMNPWANIERAGGRQILTFDLRPANFDWSPDGRSFVLVTGYSPVTTELLPCEILVSANADGSNLAELTSAGADEGVPCAFAAQWSPDSSMIAFAGERREVDDGVWGVYVVDSDGSGLRPVVEVDRPVMDVAWSPDGTHLAYIVLGSESDPDRLVVSTVDGGQSIEVPVPVGLAWSMASLDWGP